MQCIDFFQNDKVGYYDQVLPRKWLFIQVIIFRLEIQGSVLLTFLRHVARILANGSAAFFESCDAIGWNSCDVSQKR